MTTSVSILRLTGEVSEADYRELCTLLTQHYGQLSSYPSRDDVNETIKRHAMFVARNESGAIEAMATLVTYRKFAKSVGHVEEDVVTLNLEPGEREEVRAELMQAMADCARSWGVVTLDLETHADRKDDIAAYGPLGYNLREGVVVYRLKL